MDQTMITVTSIGDTEIQRKHSAGQQIIQVPSSEIKFFYTPSDGSMWVTATTSSTLPHPYAENWLSEPLRILLGQLVFPRLVARNLGDGSAHVLLRTSPTQFSEPCVASLLGDDALGSGAKFWECHRRLLTLIADARDSAGEPNFESHPLTRFYEEIIQATQGTRWVLCMTIASAAEGLARMLAQGGKNTKKRRN
jgi:hypothetical protein